MTVLFALAASLFIGVSDFLGGTASRVGSPLAVTAVLQLAALAALTPIAIVVGASDLTVHDTVLGSVGGLTASAAYVAFFTAIAHGRISIVAPVSAVVGIAEGNPLTKLATGGIFCALVAIPLVAYEPEEDRVDSAEADERWSSVKQVLVSVVCGAGFGAYFVCVGHTHRSAGLWPPVASLVLAAVVMTPVAIRRGARRELASIGRPAIAAGVALAIADAFLTIALQRGPLTIASVLGNLYPLVTIGLGVCVLGERVRSWQTAGIALAIVGVAMIAAG